jgi:hypothetical protein
MDVHYYGEKDLLNEYPKVNAWVNNMMNIKAIYEMHNDDSVWMNRAVPFVNQIINKIPMPPVLFIRKAYYGYEEVHEKLIEHMKEGKRVIEANNDWFGDSAPGLQKFLTI